MADSPNFGGDALGLRNASIMDVHRATAWAGGQCIACNSRKVTCEIKVLVPLAELHRNNPKAMALAQMMSPELIAQMTVPTIHGPYVRVSTNYACKLHQKELEQQAARGPSWAIVEIDRGPKGVGIDKAQFGRGGATGSTH